VPNLKLVSLDIFELLAFNAHRLRGHVTLATPLYEKKFRGHDETVPGSMFAKVEVRSFRHFGAISIERPKIYGVT